MNFNCVIIFHGVVYFDFTDIATRCIVALSSKHKLLITSEIENIQIFKIYFNNFLILWAYIDKKKAYLFNFSDKEKIRNLKKNVISFSCCRPIKM